jgi:hypothetical protein
MSRLEAIWHWVTQNKDWLFSGAGLSVLAVLGWIFKRILGKTNSSIPVSRSAPSQTPPQPQPDIRVVNFKAVFAQRLGEGKSCFVVAFRNEGPGDATGVIASIGYAGDRGQRMLVDYGGWIEHQPTINIPRGHTKNLIVAVTDDGRNFAVTDIAPATNYTMFRLEEVGEITAGDWKMVITLSADNYRREYVFALTVGTEGSEIPALL